MILTWPDPRLKEISTPVSEPLDPELLREMHRVMLEQKGMGLAAIQVGVAQRFFILDAGQGLEVYVNPGWKSEKTSRDRMLRQEPRRQEVREGCLSFPEIRVTANRFPEIRATWQDQDLQARDAVLTGIRAQAFQHEVEHLDGDTFIKHLTAAERSRIIGALQKARRAGRLK